jgi:hypothetical protein
MKQKFRGIFLTFTDKTSIAVPKEDKDGNKIWPRTTLRVKIPGQIPPKHRICR